jgi:hypothetical protein
MTKSPFAAFQAEGASVDVRRQDALVRITMTGSVEARDPGKLFDPYWTGLDETLRQEGVTRVALDIRGLTYMNSSGILTLVRWMMKVKSEPAYTIAIEHDPELTWQKSNVPVLAKLAPAVVSVTTASALAER